MGLISAKGAGEKLNITQRMANVPCTEDKVPAAPMAVSPRVMPDSAGKPEAPRSSRAEKRNDSKARPFLKWAGGKGQLLTEIEKYYPFDGKTVTKYAEPFVGGGAVLFDILSKYELDAVYISDINAELINTYCAVRSCVDELVERLEKMQAEYLPLDSESRREVYASNRARFNSIPLGGEVNVEKAALMVFLNRTCFNGLYRVNRRGQFNVPIGSYKSPIICDENNLRAVSEKLRNVEIVCGDYSKSADFIDGHTFVYFDPPYRPLTETANFTAYTEAEFDDEAQAGLAKFVEEMAKRGANVLVSNSDPKNVNLNDDFFERIYSFCKIYRVSASRMINSNGSARGKVSELLISNS